MIAVQVFGIWDTSTEEQLQAITKDLHDLCRVAGGGKYYVAFPLPRDCVVQMDPGMEIVAFVSGAPFVGFGRHVGEVLEQYFPQGLRGRRILVREEAG